MKKKTRGKIFIRLLITILYLIILEVIRAIIQLTVLFQYIALLITKKWIKPLRKFSNHLALYQYTVVRYVTLNLNEKPFPFKDFPKKSEIEQSEEPDFYK